jgi:protease secretion system outer membrane protein
MTFDRHCEERSDAAVHFCVGRLRRLLTPLASLLLLMGLHSAHAGPLTDAFSQARKYDALFQTAAPELDANRVSAQMAASAYYPQFQASYSRLETETSSRQTYSVTQPLINADRYATLKETGPREQIASATYQLREQDLSQRLLKAVSELLRNTESRSLNKAKMAAMQTQSDSAKKSYQVGVGTITDVRDAQVRLDQAHADTLMLEAQIGSAQRQLLAITGAPATPLMLSVPRQARAVALRALDDYVASGVQTSPQLVLALQNQRLAELAVTRANGAILPTLAAVYTYSSAANTGSGYAGVSLSLPLQAGSFYQIKGAAANASKMQEQTRETEQRTRLEVQRLWSLVNAGRAELAIRLDAIQSAQLSVEANEKSFKGGVRSQIDVLNSIQTLYQVQQDYVSAVLTLADNYLNLLLQAATPANDAVALVQNVLFPSREGK